MKNELNESKFDFQMSGEDGNAYAIMGRFQRQARRNDWSEANIKLVLDEARSGDYNNLLYTFTKYTNAQ